jgi:retinol dehydrogenase-12
VLTLSRREYDIKSLLGKVHIVTGGYSGIGLALVKCLFEKNATVYIAGRNKDKFNEADVSLKKEFPSSKGRIEFLQLDLADLSTIKASADEFLKKESRLDVLTNNAGVMSPPAGSVDAQGHELMMGTNVLGPWLFSESLLPILKSTAATAPTGSVRVTWAGSLLDFSPKGGVEFNEETGEPKLQPAQQANYGQSKAANALLASEFAQRHGSDGIISVGWNPGNMKTELGRHLSKIAWVLVQPLLYEPRFGAYTMLYAGWSSEIDMALNGSYVWPFGRRSVLRPDLLAAMKGKEDGGSGEAKRLWEWCVKECKEYL